MSKPILVMLCGLPGSGKSTYAKSLAKKINATIFSSDELRKEMFGDENEQDRNSELFTELHRRIKDCLRSGHNAIYDATNVYSNRRRSFVQELSKIDCEKRCVVMATPYEQCLRNNVKRDKVVPGWVINTMYKHWNTPAMFEGWDKISIEYWSGSRNSKDSYEWVEEYIDFKQYNVHHTMTLGRHCLAVGRYITNHEFCDTCLRLAGYLHDVGKPKVMKFENSNGEPTAGAHFYGHENVGAYDVLFFDCGTESEVLDVSVLINLHMTPYYWERDNNEKLRMKYMKLWGIELYSRVMTLHEADKAAH